MICTMGYLGEGSAGFTPPSLLSKRERFHLAYRLAGRSYQLLIAGQARTPQRRLTHIAVCAVGDIVSAVALRRSGRFALGPRLAADAVDAALWSQGSVGLELATMPGVPLAMEAGLRIGIAGLIVPVINATVTGSVRRLRGRPVSSGSFRYQAMSVALGAGIAVYERNRRQVALARHRQDLEARIGVAHLAGQNEVATGADTVVDLLSRTTPLLSSPLGSATVGRMLADWRQSLAASTAEHATYLGIALVRWQRRHNESQPDLSADVTLEITEGHGTILLSRDQAAWLEALLDKLGLRGAVRVEAVDIVEARQPNQPRRLRVGERTLDIPADPSPGLVPFDIGPLGFLASSMWFGDTLLPGEIDPSVWAVGPGVAAGPLLAIWAHRQVGRRGEAAHVHVLFAALGHALVHAAAATGTMRNTRNPEGIQRFPSLGGINMLVMMVPLYWGDLDRSERVWAIAGMGAILAMGLLLFPGRIQWSHVIAELLWPAAAFYSMATMRSQLELEAKQLSAELADSDVAIVANAFAEGRSYVLGLVSETRYAAHRDLAAVWEQLDERLRAEAARRLNEVDKRLEELTCANES
jgi:hypothetical protein